MADRAGPKPLSQVMIGPGHPVNFVIMSDGLELFIKGFNYSLLSFKIMD